MEEIPGSWDTDFILKISVALATEPTSYCVSYRKPAPCRQETFTLKQSALMNSLASEVHAVYLLPLRVGGWKPSVTEKARLGFETSSHCLWPFDLAMCPAASCLPEPRAWAPGPQLTHWDYGPFGKWWYFTTGMKVTDTETLLNCANTWLHTFKGWSSTFLPEDWLKFVLNIVHQHVFYSDLTMSEVWGSVRGRKICWAVPGAVLTVSSSGAPAALLCPVLPVFCKFEPRARNRKQSTEVSFFFSNNC